MNKLKSIIEKFLRFPKKLKEWIKPCPKQQKLYPLGANNNDEKESEPLKPYFSAIEDAIEQKFINVGLVGDYSSGKSTIIENYLKNSKNKHKAIYLSLAKIGDLKINNKEEPETWKKTIQEKILELLFFQAKVTVPNGSFKKVFSFSKRFNCLFSILLAIVSTIFIFQDFNPSNHWFLKEITNYKELLFIIAPFFIAVSFLLGICYHFLMKFLTFLVNIDYGKFKLTIAEVQAETELTKLPFHKHLREIIYIVQQLTAKESVLVIVEDLDRFNSLDIFTEIREIAILLNKSLENHKLVFLYALRSQIFVKKSGENGENPPNNQDNAVEHVVDIGKFFDVIIPVVKSYNNHNLAEIIVKQITTANTELENNRKDREDLLAVADILCKNEIVDFRIANNICNHFNIIYRIYQAKYGKDTKYCPAKILAITIYRIFDPIDYDNLHNKCGILYEHFNTSDILDYKKTAIENYTKIYYALQNISKINNLKISACSDSRDKFKISFNHYNRVGNTEEKTLYYINFPNIEETISKEDELDQETWKILEKTIGDIQIYKDEEEVTYNEKKLSIVGIFRHIYKEIKKLKQQDQINEKPLILLSKVSQQLIVENYINKDYKKYLFESI